MKAHWWSCVLGLICMPAGVILIEWTASQNPPSISPRVNSSAEIVCSTSLSDPMGLSLRRHFSNSFDVIYLALDKGQIIKNTSAADFKGRIHVSMSQQVREDHGFSLKLSLLELKDTNLYYCTWAFMESNTAKTLSSNGTVIIVRESGPVEECESPIFDLTLFGLIITAISVILFVIIGAMIFQCKRFKKDFTPARGVKPPRPNRLRHICLQQPVQHSPYMITSANPSDFRDIL